jgi:hypothetical protein
MTKTYLVSPGTAKVQLSQMRCRDQATELFDVVFRQVQPTTHDDLGVFLGVSVEMDTDIAVASHKDDICGIKAPSQQD